MRTLEQIILALFVPVALCAQTSPAQPEFEVASIRPTKTGADPGVRVGLHIDGAQVHYNSLSLKDLIRMAWQVKDFQVAGPEWMASERFDIAGTIPAGATRNQVPDMLKALLSQRFQISTHNESKEFPVYGLVLAKGGLKMKESTDPGASALLTDTKAPLDVNVDGGPGGVNIALPRGSSFSLANDKIEAKKLTMAEFVDLLWRFTDRPVVDMTGLKGAYDFTLQLTPEDYYAMLIQSAVNAGVSLPPQALQLMEGVTKDSFYAALQLVGLKLETRKAPLDVLVIDHVSKTPTEN